MADRANGIQWAYLPAAIVWTTVVVVRFGWPLAIVNSIAWIALGIYLNRRAAARRGPIDLD